MMSGIIVILAALVPFIVSVVAAKVKKDNDPETLREQTDEQIDKDIATHNAADVTLLTNKLLDQLQNGISSNTSKS